MTTTQLVGYPLITRSSPAVLCNTPTDLRSDETHQTAGIRPSTRFDLTVATLALALTRRGASHPSRGCCRDPSRSAYEVLSDPEQRR
eukprot:755792-Prorocentrum_minimum.AAC.1